MKRLRRDAAWSVAPFGIGENRRNRRMKPSWESTDFGARPRAASSAGGKINSRGDAEAQGREGEGGGTMKVETQNDAQISPSLQSSSLALFWLRVPASLRETQSVYPKERLVPRALRLEDMP